MHHIEKRSIFTLKNVVLVSVIITSFISQPTTPVADSVGAQPFPSGGAALGQNFKQPMATSLHWVVP